MLKRKREFLKTNLNLLIFLFIFKNIYAFPKVHKTKILSDPIFLKNIHEKNHPENAERISHFLDYIKQSDLSDLMEMGIETRNVEQWIRNIHTDNHIKHLKENEKTAEEMSRYAVMCCLNGVDQIMSGEANNIFCAVRPPGHHAMNTGKEEGFCFYNHVAIASKYIQKEYNLKKILIIDWDYHHGNSTEYFFYSDPSVFFFSTHDQFAYPGTGSPQKIGKGKGKGFNLNIHLRCGSGDEKIISVFKKKLLPIAESFKPDFIIISAGFDSRINDKLGCFKITDQGFFELTKIVQNIAKNYSKKRLLSVLEGGYNIRGNAKASISHINALTL